MKLNKFNKKLKQEFNDTIDDPKVVVEEKRFKFKFRYVFLALAAAIILILTIDHINVQNYNNSIVNQRINYSELNISESRYTSKNELSSALIYDKVKTKRTSALDGIAALFTLKGCTSSSPNHMKQETSQMVEETGTSLPPDDMSPENGNSNNSYNTNVQEKGIDEADTAKCDGKYIYSICDHNLYIFDLEGNEIVKENIYGYTSHQTELYIYEDKIITISSTDIAVYTFNGTKIELSKTNNGEIIDTRMTDGKLYYIIRDNLNLDRINYDNAYYDGCINPCYLYRVFKLDLNSLEQKEADLVSLYSTVIYMSDNYFYFTTSNSDRYANYTNVFILDYDLNGYAAFKEIGKALNQYSFSEYEGMFRYVLTDRTKEIYNSIYVYDLANKKLAGSLLNQIGLAHELVKSVRFDKNICYVCTYRNTDPLYAIDLNDPQNITIKSELHVSGYSGYLHNFTINDKKYVLGIGYSEINYPKISIYEVKEDEQLEQVGKSLVICDSSNIVLFDELSYVPSNIDYFDWSALVSSYRGYRFYFVDDILYFGAPTTNNIYNIYKIDVNAEEAISVYKEHIYENINNVHNYNYKNLRCFIINSKLYFVGNGTISIEEF